MMLAARRTPAVNSNLDDQLRELLPRLRRFAFRLTRSTSSADDLVQTTLERALSHWGTRRNEEALQPWLFAILYRQFVDAHRRSRRQASILDRFSLGQRVEQPSAEREVVAQSMLEALERLPPEQRSLLLWVSVEGLAYQEVADILEVPVGTVMSRLSRARQALRRLCEGETKTPTLRLLK
jgi:RNA polymerase sigma-70 factor (ECF subfamily)